MKTLTIFTPTYNRSYILHELYQSLCRQSIKDFVWIILDDGSTDRTGELVEQWVNEDIISIIYQYQDNGGKMRAHNKGVLMAKTELFLCVDSDDFIVDDAVESILDTYKEIRSDCAGIIAYRGRNSLETMTSSVFPEFDYSTLGNIYKTGFIGDTTLVYRTDILKQYLFPEIDNEKFITENYIYSQIDQKYKMRIFSKVIIICEYREDGYTRSGIKLKRDNPKGWAMYYNQQAQFATNKKEQCYYIAQYICYSLLGNNKRIITTCKNQPFALLMFPAGILLKWKRYFQYIKLE